MKFFSKINEKWVNFIEIRVNPDVCLKPHFWGGSILSNLNNVESKRDKFWKWLWTSKCFQNLFKIRHNQIYSKLSWFANVRFWVKLTWSLMKQVNLTQHRVILNLTSPLGWFWLQKSTFGWDYFMSRSRKYFVWNLLKLLKWFFWSKLTQNLVVNVRICMSFNLEVQR